MILPPCDVDSLTNPASNCCIEKDLLDDLLFLFNVPPPEVSESSQSNQNSEDSSVSSWDSDMSNIDSNMNPLENIVLDQAKGHDALDNDNGSLSTMSSVSQKFVDLFDHLPEDTRTPIVVTKCSSRIKKVQSKRPRGRPKRDPSEGWPKRPLSAYNIFFQRERFNAKKIVIQQMSVYGKSLSGNVTQTIANAWNNLTDEEKAPYKKLAAISMIKYREQVAAHRRMKQATKRVESRNDSQKVAV